jgi:hypothetical protein
LFEKPQRTNLLKMKVQRYNAHREHINVIPTKRQNKFRKTFENMEGFSIVMPVTGLIRPNTGKEDNDDRKH